MRITRRFGLAAALLLVTVSAATAQTSRISGVVRDETGGTIRGAIVRAAIGGLPGTSPATLTTATDERGRFIFVVARSGEWQLNFEAPGFDPMTIAVGVRLTGAAPNLDIKLDRHEAPEAFGALAGIDSKSLSAQLGAASALLDEGHYDQAIAAYRDIKTRVPALTMVNLPLGSAYLGKKSYGEAESAFQEILKADPADANGLFAMGRLREMQGNAAEAQAWYQKASGADAMWTRPLMKLATLARAAGDKGTAAKYLTRVIALDPASPDAVEAAAMQGSVQ
jgi:Flp pilus assembly protein TadD